MRAADGRRPSQRARSVHEVELELVHVIALVALVLFAVLIVLPALIDLAGAAAP